MKSAFTMMELVFVIVVLGILATVAVPRMFATRDDATITRGRADISAIQSGIALQKARNLLLAEANLFPLDLDDASFDTDGEELFFSSDGNASNILERAIFSLQDRSGHWNKTAADTYEFFVTHTSSVSFDYNQTTGSFDCDHAIADCQALTE